MPGLLGEFIIGFFIFLGLSGVASKTFFSKYHAEHVAGMMFAMIVLYVFSCVQQLRLGMYVVIAFAVVGLVFSLRSLIFGDKNRFLIFRQAFELACFCSLAFVCSWGAEYWIWDEFSHWGAELDYLSIANNLPAENNVLLFADYIPGITLLRYFAGKIMSEQGVSSYYFITWLFGLMAIYSASYSISRAKWAISAIVIFFAYLFFFQSLTLTLLVDPVQALLFLCALRFCQENDDDSFRIVVIAAISVVLLKHVGLILGGCIWLYYVLVRIFIDKSTVKAISARAGALLMLVVLTYASWALYVHAYEFHANHSSVSVFSAGNGFVSNISIGLGHVLNNIFPHAVFLTPAYPLDFLTPGIPLWIFICAVAAVMLLVTLNARVSRRSRALALGFLVFTAAGYLLFLSYIAISFSWLFDRLSFARYFLVLFFATYLLQYLVARDGLSVARCALVAVIMILASYVVSPPLGSIFVQSKRLPVLINEEYRQKAEALKKYAKVSDSIYYIDGKNSSFGYFIFRSKALPLNFNHYSQSDYLYRASKNKVARLERLKNTLCGFEYIYADGPTDEFWGTYSSVFDKVGGASIKWFMSANITAGLFL